MKANLKMASGRSPLASDVLVSLSAKSYRPDFQHPERRIVLKFDPESPSAEKTTSISIGRTSKRFEHLGAKKGNCYFDSPVMSREHAVMTVDWWHKKLFIKDIGSLHGTYQNSQRLAPFEPREVVPGDTIKFGIDIQRSTDLFPPCTVEVHFEFNHLVKLVKEKPRARPSFSVPSDSDSSDEEDDKAESDISPSIEKLRSIDQRRMDTTVRASSTAIDLTEDDPPHSPQFPPRDTIVLDDEDTAEVIEPPNNPVPIPTVPEVVEPDAPHDVEEEHVRSSPEEYFAKLPVTINNMPDRDSDSGSESEDYVSDNDSHDSSDEKSCEESRDQCDSDGEIQLTDSEKEDPSSQDEEDLETDGSESENQDVEDHDMEVDDIGTTMFDDDDEYEPEAGVDVYNDVYYPLSTQLTAAQQYYPTTSFNSVELAPMWNTLPLSEQGEQVRSNVRLPPLAISHLGLSEFHESRLTATTADAQQNVPGESALMHSQTVTTDNNSRVFPQNDGPSAEDLGEMSGKREYFAAREHNKAIMRLQEHEVKTTVSVEATAPNQPAEPVQEIPKSTKLPESAWAATGTKFINSPPPQDFPENNKRAASPDLDDTSAFQFHQSKMKLAAQAPAARIAVEHSQQADRPENVRETTPTPTSPKRKAAEISTLLPEEEAAEKASPEQQSGVAQASSAPVTLNSTGPPPAKRAKRTRFMPSLGSIGTFSFGGVMISSVVVGMLAATAPSL